jgi:hypothetical protein
VETKLRVLKLKRGLAEPGCFILARSGSQVLGMLSAFSTVTGDQAANLEDLATRGLLKYTVPVVEQLDRSASELARLAGKLTIESLRMRAESTCQPEGQP